jgi:hypothetical protein
MRAARRAAPKVSRARRRSGKAAEEVEAAEEIKAAEEIAAEEIAAEEIAAEEIAAEEIAAEEVAAEEVAAEEVEEPIGGPIGDGEQRPTVGQRRRMGADPRRRRSTGHT